MTGCSAYGCTNREGKTASLANVSFHKFPVDEPRRSEWINAVRRVEKNGQNWSPSKHSVLCSAHFEEKMIDRSMKRIVLAKTAVPTIFNFPKYLQKMCEVRKTQFSENLSNAPIPHSSTNSADVEIQKTHLINASLQIKSEDADITVLNSNEEFSMENNDQAAAVSNLNEEHSTENGDQDITVLNLNEDQSITVPNLNAGVCVKNGGQGITDGDQRLSDLNGGSNVINNNQNVIILNLKDQSCAKNKIPSIPFQDIHGRTYIGNENQDNIDFGKKLLKTQISNLQGIIKTKNKQIKILQQKVRRYQKRIDNFYTLLKNKKNENITNEDVLKALNAHLQ